MKTKCYDDKYGDIMNCEYYTNSNVIKITK